MNADPPKLLSRDELAERLSVSIVTINRLIRDRTIPTVRIGGRVLFHPDDVAAFIESRTTRTT